jgi:hypothetical protein
VGAEQAGSTYKLQDADSKAFRAGCAEAAAYYHVTIQDLPSSTSRLAFSVRATPLMSPTRPSAFFFSIRTAKNGPVAPLDPRFLPDLGLHPSGEPRPSPAFRDALGDSGRNKLARNRREYSHAFPRVMWPRSVGESGRSSSSSSRLPRIVFPARIVFSMPSATWRRPTSGRPEVGA